MSMTPTPKVAAVGYAGALAVVLVWVAGLCGIDMPPEVAAALASLINFAAGFLKREDGARKGDHVA